MLLKDKGITDSTMLSLVAKLLKRDTTTKGFKVKGVDGVQPVTYAEVIQFVETLAQCMREGSYREVRLCMNCRYFDKAPLSPTGRCYPDDTLRTKAKNDYCSGWAPMTPEQVYTRRRIHELLQGKRVGDDPEDSTEGN